MKLAASFIALLPLAVVATPITSPNPSEESIANLALRADTVCYLNSDALKNDPQGCDTSPTSGTRRRGVTGGDRFGVRCTKTGKCINGNCKWDYVPGWNCYIWSGWTQQNCERKCDRSAGIRLLRRADVLTRTGGLPTC